MQTNKKVAKLIQQSKHLIYPQQQKDWERVINNSFVEDGEPTKEIYEAINYMTLLEANTPIETLTQKINEADYELTSKIKIMFTVAFYRKEGPELFRQAFGARVTPSVEKDLKGFEHNHRIYEQQLSNGKNK